MALPEGKIISIFSLEGPGGPPRFDSSKVHGYGSEKHYAHTPIARSGRLFLSVASLDDARLIAEFVGVPVADDHFNLQAHRPIGMT